VNYEIINKPPFFFPKGGKENPLLPLWGKVGMGVITRFINKSFNLSISE